jgi:ribosomal protein S11
LLLFKVEYVIQLFYVWSVFKGSEGFKNARRGTNFAGQQAAIAAAKVVILKCL